MKLYCIEAPAFLKYGKIFLTEPAKEVSTIGNQMMNSADSNGAKLNRFNQTHPGLWRGA